MPRHNGHVQLVPTPGEQPKPPFQDPTGLPRGGRVRAGQDVTRAETRGLCRPDVCRPTAAPFRFLASPCRRGWRVLGRVPVPQALAVHVGVGVGGDDVGESDGMKESSLRGECGGGVSGRPSRSQMI